MRSNKRPRGYNKSIQKIYREIPEISVVIEATIEEQI
jgi:hypothetical protein